MFALRRNSTVLSSLRRSMSTIPARAAASTASDSSLWQNCAAVFALGAAVGVVSTNYSESESLKNMEYGVPHNRKRVDPFSPFFPSDKHPCTHAGMFIPGCHELKIFSGSSHFELADEIARRLGTRVGKLKLGRFADGEVQVQVGESVRGKDVYLVQSLTDPVNDSIIETLLMVSTMRRASAKRVTAVIPYYAYKHHRRGTPISTSMNSRFLHSAAADIAKMLEVMGVDRVIAVDLQRPGQGHEACFFSLNVPVETIETVVAGTEYFATQIHFRGPVVVLSPNNECFKKAKKFALGLKSFLPNAEIRLDRYLAEGSLSDIEQQPVGNMEGADVIIVDDLVDTCGTILSLSKLVKEKGARRVYTFAAHGIFSEDAEQKIEASPLDQVVVMDTIPRKEQGYHTSKIKRISVAPMLAELIQAEHFKAHSYIDLENTRDDYHLSKQIH